MTDAHFDQEAVGRALGLFLAAYDQVPELDSPDFWGMMLGDSEDEAQDTILAMAEIAIGLLAIHTDPRQLFVALAQRNAERGL